MMNDSEKNRLLQEFCAFLNDCEDATWQIVNVADISRDQWFAIGQDEIDLMLEEFRVFSDDVAAPRADQAGEE